MLEPIDHTPADEPDGHRPGNQSILHILHEDGDINLIWSADKPDEVAEVRATFEKFTRTRNYWAFEPGPGGKPGRRITTFDPAAEKIILSPAQQPG